jgi:threonine dehydratase
MQPEIPNYADIISAADVIANHAVRTPLMRNDILDEITGARVFVKPECLQRTGSFKFRGAYNAISRLSEDDLATGIVASSSGNHAQGVAKAASLFGAKSTIVMPSDAPTLKVDRTRASGAFVVFYDRETEDREACVADVLAKSGGVFIHPYEHFHVISGQGTVGLEVCQDIQEQGMSLDRVLVCTGGGGLTAGVALAVHEHFPNANLHSVEPQGFDDYQRSLKSGQLEKNDKSSGSVCDAILTPSPGKASFAINKNLLSDGVVVSDEEALAAVRFAFKELKLVVEPGGAVALAGLLQAGKSWSGETVALTISGGNVDPDFFAQIVAD